jgi:MarR family transcriptional regulator for hemolysin
MSPDRAREGFLTELSNAARKTRTLFDLHLRRRGLTLARTRALLHLSRHPVGNQTELASVLEIENPTVVRLIDGMESQGLIQRSVRDGDRRAKDISLTDSGRRHVDEIDKISAGLSSALLWNIDDDELATAADVLRRIVRNIENLGEMQKTA